MQILATITTTPLMPVMANSAEDEDEHR